MDKRTATAGSGLRLVEGTNNGENYIELKAPASVASNLTYTFPASITAGGYLLVDSNGDLSWDDTLDATSVNATGVGTVAFLQSTTVNVSAGATITGALDVDGGADFSGNGITVTEVNASGVVTATTFDGNLATTNLTGTITNAQLAGSIANDKLANDSVSFGGVSVDLGAADATPAFDLQDATNLPTTSLTGTITNAQLAGSIADSKLNTISTANKVAASALDIDGATATSSLADADLLLVDDGANGTNRKLTASNLKSYVLGGGSGATFAQINVTGISTNTFMKSTTATVGAGLTVGGALDGNGGANISGGETVLSSATVSDLTDGRIVTAGSAGALEDDANLTWDGSTLGVGGAINGSNGASITGAETVLSSATVSDLTSGRVVLAGSSGAVEDSANLTFNGSTLAVNGSITATSNLTVTGDLVVNGNTTQINTVNTTIEDTLLELQKVDGGNLSSDTNKDVGLVMNYYSGSAKKAAVFWDDSAARFVLASEAAENSGVLTPSAYAGLEVGSLYVNDCAGASQVISCSGTTRSLENVTIDGGSF